MSPARSITLPGCSAMLLRQGAQDPGPSLPCPTTADRAARPRHTCPVQQAADRYERSVKHFLEARLDS